MIAALVMAVLLQSPPDGPISTAAPDPAAPPAPAPAAAPAAAPPIAAMPAAAPAAAASRLIDDPARPLLGAAPQGPYEEAVRGAFTRQQSLQGPLDGTWVMKDAGGTELYRLQLVDRGPGGPPIEGAWADLQAGAGPHASGFLTGAERAGSHLSLQFAPPGGGVSEAVLDQRPDGGFVGELKAGPETKPRPVILARP